MLQMEEEKNKVVALMTSSLFISNNKLIVKY